MNAISWRFLARALCFGARLQASCRAGAIYVGWALGAAKACRRVQGWPMKEICKNFLLMAVLHAPPPLLARARMQRGAGAVVSVHALPESSRFSDVGVPPA